MRLGIFRSSITISVTAAILSIILLNGIFIAALHNDIKSETKRKEKVLKETVAHNNYYIKIIKFKADLVKVIKDVSYTSFMAQNNVVRFKDLGGVFDFQEDKRREKIWERQILPVLDSLDIHMDDGFSDGLKASFNKLNDKIIKTYNLQKKITRDTKVEGNANTADVLELRRLTASLSKNYNDAIDESKEAEELMIISDEIPNEDSVFLIAVFLVVITLIILVTTILISFLRKPIKKLEDYLGQLRIGSFPNDIVIRNYDYRPITRSLNYITRKLKKINIYADRVGTGDFELNEELEFERDGDLGNSLAGMQDSLLQVAEKDRQRDHINKGLGTFSDILSSYTNNIEQFSEEVTRNLVKFLNANQGVMFIVEENEEGKQWLEMSSCYAYDKKKFMSKRVEKGQGLVGQAWMERKRIYMTEVPEGYTSITSGLGYSTPNCILIIPLVFNEEVHGVLELASFQVLQPYELEFVDEVTESISSSLASVKINSQTQDLLLQSEELTERLIKQEEEMRTKVDELAVIQNEAKMREEEHIREIRRLKKRIDTYERHL